MEKGLCDYTIGGEKAEMDVLIERARERIDDEHVGAIYLLVTVFTYDADAEWLIKRLDEFSVVYGESIPGWLQILYECMDHSGAKAKVEVIKDYAKKHDIKLHDASDDTLQTAN